jgi:hypothetical protein
MRRCAIGLVAKIIGSDCHLLGLQTTAMVPAALIATWCVVTHLLRSEAQSSHGCMKVLCAFAEGSRKRTGAHSHRN